MEHFKQELIDYLDYYNNRRIKEKLKGLPPAFQTASPFGCLNNSFFEILSNFLGSLQVCGAMIFSILGSYCVKRLISIYIFLIPNVYMRHVSFYHTAFSSRGCANIDNLSIP